MQLAARQGRLNAAGLSPEQRQHVANNEHDYNLNHCMRTKDIRHYRAPIRPLCAFCKRTRCTDLCRALNWDTRFTCPIWRRDGLYGRPLTQLPDKRLKTIIVIGSKEDASTELKSLVPPSQEDSFGEIMITKNYRFAIVVFDVTSTLLERCNGVNGTVATKEAV